MSSSNLELVSEAFTLVTIDEIKKYIFKTNQAFVDRDPTQSESLIQPHQMRAFGVIVDDCAKSHLGPTNLPGGQCISIENKRYGMHFDGWKYYFRIQNPTAKDLLKYEIIELTSNRPYDPQRRYKRRVQGDHTVDLTEWRSRLGYRNKSNARQHYYSSQNSTS